MTDDSKSKAPFQNQQEMIDYLRSQKIGWFGINFDGEKTLELVMPEYRYVLKRRRIRKEFESRMLEGYDFIMTIK